MRAAASRLLALLRDRSGAVAVEYALIVGLIVIGVIVWATQVGGTAGGFFTDFAAMWP